MIAVSASLLAADQSRLLEEIDSLPAAITSLHLDLEDGVQVPNFGLSLESIKALPRSWDKDVHLMVAHPEQLMRLLQDCNVACFYLNIGAWNQRLKWGISPLNVGLVINPTDDILNCVQSIKEANNVLVMGVIPGRSGQKMLPDTLARVQAIRKLNSTAQLTVDGGVNDQNAQSLIAAGANKLVIGSYLFQAENKETAVKKLLDLS